MARRHGSFSGPIMRSTPIHLQRLDTLTGGRGKHRVVHEAGYAIVQGLPAPCGLGDPYHWYKRFSNITCRGRRHAGLLTRSCGHHTALLTSPIGALCECLTPDKRAPISYCVSWKWHMGAMHGVKGWPQYSLHSLSFTTRSNTGDVTPLRTLPLFSVPVLYFIQPSPRYLPCTSHITPPDVHRSNTRRDPRCAGPPPWPPLGRLSPA
ncbi:hypothetical protein E2C01_028813 [Portunus trituberculatus]|uniref:Uncharacterized protein n=1 Tax=Portunus trituberculatus TaxID=210409 RepID=A0A5B7ELN5_PORTR|nr:hypothetical protein [Portunus trituberculatus]